MKDRLNCSGPICPRPPGGQELGKDDEEGGDQFYSEMGREEAVLEGLVEAVVEGLGSGYITSVIYYYLSDIVSDKDGALALPFPVKGTFSVHQTVHLLLTATEWRTLRDACLYIIPWLMMQTGATTSPTFS